MNSRSGMSTPVRQHVHRNNDRRVRAIAKLADALQRPVHCRASGDFLHERIPASKTSRARSTSWSAWEVCGRSLTAKISVFGNRPYRSSCSSAYFLISSRILRLESGEVISCSTAALSNCALVLQHIHLFGAGLGIDDADFLSFFEEDTLHAHVGFHFYDVVIHEEAFPNGPFVFIPVDDVLEVRRSVQRRAWR